MQVPNKPIAQPSATAYRVVHGWTLLALIAALTASLGSLYLSVQVPVNVGGREMVIGMNRKACPLCFYQRTFAFSTLGVLLVGLLTKARRTGAVGVLALPLAVGGLGVAGFHVYLELNGVLECPKGIADIGSAPQQSLAAFGVLTLFLLIDSLRNRAGGAFGLPSILFCLILGAAFAYGCVISAPPLPPAPAKEYDPEKQPFDTCRPPYHQ